MDSHSFPSLILFRPREGYELHHSIIRSLLKCSLLCYRPREGYELHHFISRLVADKAENVIVPVRGMSCIQILMAMCRRLLVIVPVRGMSCIGKSKQT